MAQKKDSITKEFAKNLFLQSKSIKEIAARTDVREQTIYKWKKAGEWDALKTTLIITKKEELGRLYRQLHELNTVIEERDKGARYASGKEADIIAKLGAAIRQLENDSSVAQIIDSCMGLVDFAIAEGGEDKDAFIAICDKYINLKLSQQ